jgi:hypothetical protein
MHGHLDFESGLLATVFQYLNVSILFENGLPL